VITFIFNQKQLSGGQHLPERMIKQVAEEISHQLKVTKPVFISVAFISEKEIKAYNKTYRGVDRVTDVLSFSFEDNKDAFPEMEKVMGEILLCYPQAKKQAKEAKHSARKELIFLLIHGSLHLFGHEHQTIKQAEKMFILQKKLLSTFGIISPV